MDDGRTFKGVPSLPNQGGTKETSAPESKMTSIFSCRSLSWKNSSPTARTERTSWACWSSRGKSSRPRYQSRRGSSSCSVSLSSPDDRQNSSASVTLKTLPKYSISNSSSSSSSSKTSGKFSGSSLMWYMAICRTVGFAVDFAAVVLEVVAEALLLGTVVVCVRMLCSSSSCTFLAFCMSLCLSLQLAS